MSDSLIKKIADYIEQSLKSFPNLKHVDLSWFGGEPLLAYSKIQRITELINRTLDRTSITWDSRMATNGAYFNVERAIWMRLHANLKGVEITLDGSEFTHNLSRPVKAGKRGTYLDIVENLGEILENEILTNLRISIRINLHKGNLKDVQNLLDDLAQRGFQNYDNLRLNFVPVFSWGKESDNLVASRSSLAKIELQLQEKAYELGFSSTIFPQEPVKGFCKAVNRFSSVIDVDGSLYKCTEHPMVELYKERRIGDISDGPAAFNASNGYSSWIKQLEDGKVPCSECELLPVCGGVCPRQWELRKTKPCPLFAFNLPDRLTLLGKRLGLDVVKSHG